MPTFTCLAIHAGNYGRSIHAQITLGKAIAKHTKVGMIWVAGRSPTLVSQNLKATTLTYLAIEALYFK
jgi:sulfopyruvate decarboxylase TPP-binding subunit